MELSEIREQSAKAEEVQPMQSGRIQAYVIWFLSGIILLTLVLLAV